MFGLSVEPDDHAIEVESDPLQKSITSITNSSVINSFTISTINAAAKKHKKTKHFQKYSTDYEYTDISYNGGI